MVTRLVIVVDVDGLDPALVDPHEVAGALLDEYPEVVGMESARFVRAEWEDTVRREGADALVDDEDE